MGVARSIVLKRATIVHFSIEGLSNRYILWVKNSSRFRSKQEWKEYIVRIDIHFSVNISILKKGR